LRVVSDSSVHGLTNWYDDEYHHAVDDDVDCSVVCSDERRTMDIRIASKEGEKTAGVRLDIHLSTDDHGEPNAHVTGHWHVNVDRPNMSSHGDLADFEGTVYLSSSYFVRSRPLSIKFHLTTKVHGEMTVLMGGVRVKS
jgi:hypothetical protein